MSVFKNIRRGLAVATLAAMAACGGGGSEEVVVAGGGGGNSGGNAPPTVTALGFWGGSLSGGDGNAFRAVVLESGEVWALYGNDVGGTFYFGGFLNGVGTISGSTFSASVKDYGEAPAITGSMSADVVDGVSFNGSVRIGGGTVNFQGAPIEGANYDQPADLSMIVGEWTLGSTSGSTIGLTIAADGTFEAYDQFGCRMAGSISPHSSGKNLYAVQMAFGVAPCALAGQVADGVAVASTDGSTTNLLLAVMNFDRTYGAAASGSR